jgi:hypothetical protein
MSMESCKIAKDEPTIAFRSPNSGISGSIDRAIIYPPRAILFAVTEFLVTGSQVPLLLVIDAI